ncbi:hypothetical protein HYU20_01030 [Candidatus Woesearchaeota archaeon]|nr:hypothetical protein [Candidatus Woesearchaeota archaeon]
MDLTLKELKNLGYSKSEISEILSLATPKNSRRIHINVRQIQEAVRISNVRKVPRKDALHAILCRDNDFILIARDRHFELLKEITEAKKPEEVI